MGEARELRRASKYFFAASAGPTKSIDTRRQSNVGQQTDISSDRFTSADAVHDARRQAGSGVRQRTKTTRVNELFGTKMNQARDRAALRKRDTLATIRNDVRARDNLPRLKPQTIC